MKYIMVLSLALGAATPVQSAVPSHADRLALLQLAERMDKAWTVADAEANGELFAIDATARFSDEPLGAGRDQIREQFQAFFKGRPSDLRHVTKIERVEQLAADLAMWDAEVRVERQDASGAWATLTRIRNVTIIVRQLDGWRIQTVRAFPVIQ